MLLHLVYAAAKFFGYVGKVLPVHIVANSLFGGATVAAMFLLLTGV